MYRHADAAVVAEEDPSRPLPVVIIVCPPLRLSPRRLTKFHEVPLFDTVAVSYTHLTLPTKA